MLINEVNSTAHSPLSFLNTRWESALHEPLIQHTDMWFYQCPEAVKWQLLHAAESKVAGETVSFGRDYGYFHLQTEDLAILYRVLNSFHHEKGTVISQALVKDLRAYILGLTTTDPQKSQELITCLAALEDSNLQPIITELNTQAAAKSLEKLPARSETSLIPYTVFPVTQAEADDFSALEKLPDDILIRICEFAGNPQIRRACKQLNALYLKAAPLFVNMLKRVASFPSTQPILDRYQLDLPNTSKYEIAVKSYCRLLEGIRNHRHDYTLPENLTSNLFSLETIERLSQDYRITQDESLIAFCEALPENIREQLLDQSVVGLSLHDKAAALRERISASKRETMELLNLSDKNLSSIPPEIVHFPCISLYLFKNPIRSIPLEIGQLGNLQYLYAGETQIKSLPPEIGQLENLHELNVSHTPIKSLPLEIGQLKDLLSLNVSHTLITSLPPELSRLKKLYNLDVSHTRVASLPPEIGQLKNLASLSVHHTQIAFLPSEIGQLKDLLSLNVSHTQIKSLPPWIAQLESLLSLHISHTPLASLPFEIEKLKSFTNIFF